MHQLQNALDGDLDELIAQVEAHTEADKLKQATESDAESPRRDDPGRD
jgi:hypothetical protein